MTKELTDETVALALGWTKHHDEAWDGLRWFGPNENGNNCWHHGTPPFTTSLDAIVGEIERRGLFTGTELRPRKNASVRWRCHVGDFVHSAPTAPLALCAALLAYLEEK